MHAAYMTLDVEVLRLRTEARHLRRTTARTTRFLTHYKEKTERLKHDVERLRRENETLKKREEELLKELEKIKQQRDTYKGMVFKPKQEALSSTDAPGKKRGGQRGHTGYGRILPQAVNHTKRVFFHHCPTCQTPLTRSRSVDHHTVTDIPAPQTIQPIVTRYEMERQWCSSCKKEVVAAPLGVIPNARFGIHLIVQLLIWKYGCRLPFSSIISLFSTTYGIDVSTGSLVAILHRTRDWLGPTYNRILAAIRASPIKHADETSWSIAGISSWVWEFLTPKEVCYTIEETRGKGVPQKMLAGSKETDVLVRDGYAAYEKLPMKQQGCWSHPLRYARDAAKREDASAGIESFNDQLLTLFSDLKAATETPFVMEERLQMYKEFMKRLEQLIHPVSAYTDVAKIQTYLANQKDEFLTALLVPGVPLTNNFAERMLRSMVIMRKISGASQSREGAQTHAVNMSVFQTIKLRNEPISSTMRSLLLQGIFGKN